MHKVTAIIPKLPKLYDRNALMMAMVSANSQMVKEAQEILWSYIAGWKARNIPQFRKVVRIDYATLSTTAKVFSIQNAGIDHPFTIKPKRKRVLKFKAKGGGVVFTRSVRHPGFKGQDFIGRLIKQTEGRYQELVTAEIRRLVK